MPTTGELALDEPEPVNEDVDNLRPVTGLTPAWGDIEPFVWTG